MGCMGTAPECEGYRGRCQRPCWDRGEFGSEHFWQLNARFVFAREKGLKHMKTSCHIKKKKRHKRQTTLGVSGWAHTALFLVFLVLEMEPRALHLLNSNSATELQAQL
jgi:hypothetical protein